MNEGEKEVKEERKRGNRGKRENERKGMSE